MANMSYCRFHNTVIDFEDCSQELLEQMFNPEETEPLSKEELKKAFQLLDMMAELLQELHVEIDYDQIEQVKAQIKENQK
jgi:hypothetical protein